MVEDAGVNSQGFGGPSGGESGGGIRLRIAVLESLQKLPAKDDLDKDDPDNNSKELSNEENLEEKIKRLLPSDGSRP